MKIRIFDDIDDTIAYAKLIEDAGASILTVHGRTIEQKRDKTGLASWKHIKGIVEESTTGVHRLYQVGCC